MCVIVDANCCHKLFGQPCDPDYIPVFEWIHKKRGILVYGGRLAQELCKKKLLTRVLKQWSSAGRAKRFPDADLSRMEAELKKQGMLKSDDAHVIALAILSRTRTICTEDQTLWADLKDRNIMGPRTCRIYRKEGHVDLLQHTPGCSGYVRLSQRTTSHRRRSR
jgi:hypothetical protein